jgi:hypothetical protein
MMWGELLGVALVSASAVLGISFLMLNFPLLFTLIRLAGEVTSSFWGLRCGGKRGALTLRFFQCRKKKNLPLTLPPAQSGSREGNQRRKSFHLGDRRTEGNQRKNGPVL